MIVGTLRSGWFAVLSLTCLVLGASAAPAAAGVTVALLPTGTTIVPGSEFDRFNAKTSDDPRGADVHS